MIVTILGSGTSQGVPVIACECEVCSSIDPRDNRTRSSALIELDGQTIVIDTGPDFRTQMLREKVKDLDAVVFTHEHKDHLAGLDDIRAFNFKKGGKAMEVFASEQVQEALKREYAYVFADSKYPGVPEVKLNTIDNSEFKVGATMIQPIEVMHYKLPVLAFRIKDFAYVTDANYISPEEKAKLKGLKVLVLNALRQSKHISHFNLEEAIALAQELGAEKTYLTHISHLMGRHKDVSPMLPENVELAYDGLRFELD